MNLEITGILIYIAAQSALGIWFARRIANEKDFFVGGRSLGPVLTSFSIFATWFGAESCIGSAGAIYRSGLSGGRADPFGYTLCLWIMALCFAVRLWKKDIITLGDLFKTRYGVSIERLGIILMVPTSLFWSAAQIRAFGQVLSASSDLELQTAVTISATLVVVYTMFGGFLADVMTDFVQGICLLVGLLILFVVILNVGGGFEKLWSSIEPSRLSFIPAEGGSFWTQLEAWMIPIAGSLVAQELISRIIATRNPEIAKQSTLIGGGMYLVVGLIPVMIGLFGPALVGQIPEHEQIMPVLAKQYLHGFVYILFAGALVSAILSTVNSTLLAVSSLTAHNLVVPLLKNPSEKKKLLVARLGVVFAGIVSYLMAFRAEGIYELVESSSSFGTSGILVIMIFGLYGNFGGAWSAAAALISGVLTMTFAESWGIQTPYIFSILISLVSFVLVELLIRSNILSRFQYRKIQTSRE